MKPFLALVFPLVVLFCGCGTEPTPTVQKKLSPSELADAIAEIKNRGGKVTLDPSGEVIEVRLNLMMSLGITDAGLEHLKGLTSLKTLELSGMPITDAGLKHLKGLTSLKVLNLWGTHITDDGLEHLKGLNSLTTLRLRDTQITDAGLEHLKGMDSLTELLLNGTQVTAVGLSEIKAALPKCRVKK